jgi:hypothetical protein
MLAIMRLISITGQRFKSLGLCNRMGIVILALSTGRGAPNVGISGPPQLGPNTPSNQQEQIRSQTQEEPRKPAPQPIPKGGQGQVETGSESPQAAIGEQGDETLAGLQALLGAVSSPDLGMLGQAFGTTVGKQNEAPGESSAVELVELGDLDGDRIPEVALRLPVSETTQEYSQGQASSSSWRGLYLLSWNGTHWKASRLAAPAENIQFKVVRLGKNTGRCIVVVNVVGEEAAPYPEIFQVREHEAALIWDSQAGDNLYNAFGHGKIEFRENAKLDQTDMVVSGRADPGLLQFAPSGHRGFSAKCVYHWDGQAYIPAQTEYSPGPDNSLYRFIAALHLHDFRTAYALIEPGKFLKTDAPSLEKFRQMIEADWREFLDDQIFQAREANAGSPDALAFELPEKHYIYLPTLSSDGKFLLQGLERKVEMPGTSSDEDSP